MREEHLDFLATFLGGLVECGGHTTAGKITHHLVFSTLEAARVAVRAALRLQRASLTVRLCRAIPAWLHLGRDAVRIGIVPPRVPQIFPLRTNVSVILVIPAEVGTRQGSVRALPFVDDGDEGQNLPLQDELDQALLGPISCVGNQPVGTQVEVFAVRSSIVRLAPTSACLTDRVASTSMMIP